MNSMRVSVIVSTYNSPSSLLKSLYSLHYQTYRGFEVLIADDGSDRDTAAAIRLARETTGLELRHVWHEDRGFRKNTILNRAVAESQGEYLVFLDGDCLARADLIATHVGRARPGQMLCCGSQIDVPAAVQPCMTREAIAHGLPFRWRWLSAQGMTVPWWSDKPYRVGCPAMLATTLDGIFRRSAGFVGCNSSAWKSDILRINGFDENIAYGVDDKDLGVRLMNAGVRAVRLKYSLVYLHLAHQRSYADRAVIQRNKRLVRQRRAQGTTWIESGMEKARQAA